jgi:DNA repair protein RecO (recombination protein O)
MRNALTTGSAGWVNTPEETAPFSLLRDYTERRLGRRIKSATMLPEK